MDKIICKQIKKWANVIQSCFSLKKPSHKSEFFSQSVNLLKFIAKQGNLFHGQKVFWGFLWQPCSEHFYRTSMWYYNKFT